MATLNDRKIPLVVELRLLFELERRGVNSAEIAHDLP
jgi:hypothetical protein